MNINKINKLQKEAELFGLSWKDMLKLPDDIIMVKDDKGNISKHTVCNEKYPCRYFEVDTKTVSCIKCDTVKLKTDIKELNK